MAMGIELKAYRTLQANGYNNDEIRDYFAENNLDLEAAGNEIASNPRRQERVEAQVEELGAQMRESEPNIGLGGIDRNNEALRGVRDMGGGVVQAGLAASDMVGATDGAEERFTDWENKNISSYEKQRKAEGEEGFDWSRLGGQATVGATNPYMGSKFLAGKVGQGAVAGGAAGAGMFSPGGFGSTGNILQTAGGGLGGGAASALGHFAQPVIEGGLNQFGSLLRWVGRKVSPGKADDIGREVADAINGTGMKMSDIPEGTARAVKEEVEAAIRGGDDPVAATRKVILREMGFENDSAPTRAQLSDQGSLWTREIEASKSASGGEPLSMRYANQLNRFDEITSDMATGLGGHSADDIAATTSAFDNILNQWHKSQKEVSGLYKTARENAVGAETTLDSFSAKISELWELGLDETIPQVKQAWKQLKRNGMDADGNTLVPINANRLEEMKIALQAGWKNLDGKQKRVVRDLTESLMDDADKMGNPFKKARAAAQERFTEFDNPLVNAITGDKANEVNFISTKLLGGKPKDIAELKLSLSAGGEGGAQAWNNLKGRVFDHFMKASYQGNRNSTTSQFSGKMLGKALEGKDSVLREIFDPEEVAMLHKLVTTGEWLFSPRRMSNVNNSNTASALVNATNSAVSHIPGAQILKKGVQGMADDFTTAQSLSGMPPLHSPGPIATGGGQVVEELLKRSGIPIVPNILTEGEQQ